MLAHIALALAPMLTPTATPTPHTLTANAPIEIWARGLGDLRGLAVDTEGRVWLTDHAGGRVLRLDGPGSMRVVASDLAGPIGIAIADGGRVLVAEHDAGRIVDVAAAATGRVVADGLQQPRWLAVADDGALYVSAQRTPPEGADATLPPGVVLALREGRPPALLAHGLHDPEGVAVRDGVVHVATRPAILQIPVTADGAARLHADTLRKPVGLAIDADGTVFVTAHRLSITEEHINGVISRLDEAGTADLFASGADDPQGAAFDRDGNLYFADGKTGMVVRFLAPRPPTVVPPPEWTNAASVTLVGVAEAEARVDAMIGDTTAQVYAGSSGAFTLTLPLLAERVNRAALRAVGLDGAGLASTATVVTLVQDSRPPAIALESPPSGALVRGPVAIQASFADAGSQLGRIELVAAGQTLSAALASALPAALATATAEWSSAAAVDGTHTLMARAVDRAGNAASVTRSITVDNTPPVTEIAGPEPTAEGLRFTFAGQDNLTADGELQFAWRLDGAAWSPFSGAKATTLTGLAPGPHAIEAKARDRAGNEDPVPARLAFAVGGGRVSVRILEPAAGATLTAGTVLVRGSVDGAGDDVGVIVNGLPGWLEGSAFTALAEVDPDTTTIVASVVASDGRTGRAAIPITVAGASAVTLSAMPWSGVAPLVVRFSLAAGPTVASVELDADGDGVADVVGRTLDEQVVSYPRPGVYVARAIITDITGSVTTASAVVRVFDAAALDAHLRAKWTAMRDALRRGDITAGVSHIVQRRQADYETAFRLLSPSLPAIDSILTDLVPVKVRNASAIYEMRRLDDGIPTSFEIRFAIDGDGVWRLEAF